MNTEPRSGRTFYRRIHGQPARHGQSAIPTVATLTPWWSRAAAVLVVLAAAIFAGPVLAAVDLRVESRPVSAPIAAYVTVTDASGQPVGALSVSDFTVTLDGSPITLQPSDFSLPPAQNPDQRVSVVFVMDYSGSTGGAPRVAMREAVVSFVNAMTPGDYAAIVKFGASPTQDASVAQPFTEIDGAAGTSMLTSIAMAPYPSEGTNLYDAALVAIGHFSAPPVALPAGPKAVIMLSDGRDNTSVATLDSVVSQASSAGIALFTIAVGNAGSVGQQVLNSLAARTGGTYISAPTDSAITAAYGTMASLLNNGYLLSFSSTISDCNQHTLQVQVTGQAATSTKITRCDAQKPAPTKSGGGGGGGALGVPELLIGLAGLVAVRRRRV